MPQYKVTITELCTYRVLVEADNEDDARGSAEEILVQADDINNYFVGCDSRDVTDVEEIK